MSLTSETFLAALANTNVQAFLRVIREGESNQDESAFTILYGGSHFASFDDHPRQRFPIVYQGKENYTTAAGAFQITETTWNEFTKLYGPKPFDPENQTNCAVWRLFYRKAIDDVIAGRLSEAIRKCTQEWTSLAIPARQKAAPSIFEAYGGRVGSFPEAPAVPDIPSPVPIATPSVVPQKVGFMAPLIIPILSAIAELIPSLGKLGFGSGSEVAQRNVAAGAMVAEKIVEATNAVNIQEAAEKIQSDPAALQAARDAVSEVVQLIEAGGGGIDGARKQASSPDAPPILHQGAFWVSLLLIAMPFMLLVDLFYVHPDAYDANLRTQIVTAVLLTIGMVGSFWLGTTFNSGKKDSVIAGLAK